MFKRSRTNQTNGESMKTDNFLNQKWLNRFEILRTDDGFMAYDHDCDEYLHDENGDNCFDGYSYAMELVNDAIATVQEHQD